MADLRADEAMQNRIDYLAERANEGLLTDDEREEYSGYLHAIDVITVLQAKARSLSAASRFDSPQRTTTLRVSP